MDVLGDVLARDRRDDLGDALALRHDPTGAHIDYRRFCTIAWKTGNFLRNEGVRGGMPVVVDGDPAPPALLSVCGAGLLGATVDVGGPVDAETRALVAPTATLDGYDAGPRTRRIAYGDEHPDPSVAMFERDVWSENPTEPPDSVRPDDPLLRTSAGTLTHGEALAIASGVVDAHHLDADSAVVVRGPLTDPGVAVAGLLAALLVGGTIVVPVDGAAAEPAGDVAVGEGPEPRQVPLEDVL